MLDAVLPLVQRDLGRFRILERSMAAHLLPLATCWVIVPDREYRDLVRSIRGRRMEVVPESRIAPEVSQAARMKGWHKQQLIKLAMAEHVETKYYLVFDADVICARPITNDDLFQGDKAVCHRYRKDTHAQWYRWAERVLGVRRSGWEHGVTPTVLCRSAVLRLAAYLNSAPPRPGEFSRRLLLAGRRVLQQFMAPQTGNRPFACEPGRWRQVLIDSLPWTEYALYFTYLEATGQFDDFHVSTNQSLCGESVWHRASFANWDPLANCGDKPRPFLVVQSNAQIPPELVSERVERLYAA